MQTQYLLTKRGSKSLPSALLTQTPPVLNVFFVRALSDRLGSAALIVNAVNPGFCISELRRSIKGPGAVISWIAERIFAFTTEEGSRRLVWGALGQPENPDALRGQYINQCRVDEASDFVISPEGRKAQDDIWVLFSEFL